MARLVILLKIFCIYGNLAHRYAREATTASPTSDVYVSEDEMPLPAYMQEQPVKCNAISTDSITDVADLVRWVKLGKPSLQCSYSAKDSSRIFSSLERTNGYIQTPIIPVDDGFEYKWTSPSKGVSLLSRSFRKEGKGADPHGLLKVSIPDAGIQTFVEIDEDFGRKPIHGVDGFYGYDFYDGDYSSPTITNAEEDLIFNVTMAATVFDIMSVLFPEEVYDMCSRDGNIGDLQYTPYSSPQYDDRGSDGEGRHTHAHGRPARVRKHIPGSLLEGEDFSIHNKLGRRLLMNFRFLADNLEHKKPAASNRPVFRPYGDKTYYKGFGQAQKVYRGADVLL